MAPRKTAALIGALASAGLLTTGFAAAAPTGASLASPAVTVRPLAHLATHTPWVLPPTTAQCRASFHISCYAPFQLQQAYDLKSLYARGLTGRGRTIVLVDAFGSPTIRHDLAKFDRDFRLPDPPRFDIITPAGPVHHNVSDPTQSNWGEETSLDVEWSHAMAPGANILLVETPVAETEGLVGIPQIVQAENYVINHNLGDVISQSFGATEETFPSPEALRDQRSAFINAANHNVTVLASSGDAGPTSARFNGNYFTTRVNSWPSSDPLVTSMGGTQLHLDANGNRERPDNVWNDQALCGGPCASGGGLSDIFERPWYQDSVRNVVGDDRGTPDISMSAAVNGGVIVYIGYTGGDGITPGYYIFGGTSEASPLFAGVVSIADQAAGHRLGLLNPMLYNLAQRGAPGIVDITRGNTTVSFTQNGHTYTVPGYRAVPGYDLATGLGTIDGAALVSELSH